MTAAPELQAAATAYHKQGFAIIPFVIDPETKKKVPDTKKVPQWHQWQTRPQTQAEFNSLQIENYTMFGVICGTPINVDGETLYFIGIDRDVKDAELTEETKQLTLQALNEMKPYTRREKTRSGGNHLYYYSRKLVDGKKFNKIGMEILGKGNLVVMAPSEGYTTENDNSISTVENAETIFYKALEKFGLYSNKTNSQFATKNLSKNAPLRPCFTKLVKKHHLEHLEKVALIYEMHYSGMTEQEIKDVFHEHQAWEPAPEHVYSQEKTNSQIEYTVRKAKEGNYRYRSETLDTPDLRMCFPECELITLKDCRRLHPTITELCEIDGALKKLYKGDLNDYPTAEAGLVILVATLYSYDFSVREARETLDNSKIEKWLKGSDFFKEKVFKKADKILDENTPSTDADQERENEATRLYKICQAKNIELFHDQNKTEFARIPIEDNDTNDINDVFETNNGTNDSGSSIIPSNIHGILTPANTPLPIQSCENSVNTVNTVIAYEIVRLKDENFKKYLAHLFYEAEGKALNRESANQAILLLKYSASHGKCCNLYNRVAPDPSGNGSIWLDMADAQNRAYHITKDGWTLETNVPILFRRYEHQTALTEAAKDGDVKKILEYVNIGANKNSELTKHRQLLLLVQTASYLIPTIAHPVNAMFGCPGTHKSTAQRFIREIFDPSAVPILGIPRDENAALQVLDHHYIPIFDNLDFLPRWFSDMICKAVTGAGQESRALYTDDDSFIRSFRRCVMLNGLNLPATKGDLLNRTIMHPTEPNVERRTEEELNKKYIADLPKILGGFLDLTVKALKTKETLKATKLFRLADFSEWGIALTNALGESDDEFIKAMEENLKNQNTADIDNNIVADAFLAYCTETLDLASATEDSPKTFTPDKIFTIITAKAADMGVNIKNSKKWPSAANGFTRRLNESKSALISCGWNFEVSHNGKNREMAIWRTGLKPISLAADNKPKFIVEIIKPAEVCSYCNINSVEYSIKTPSSGTQRRCEGCFNNLKKEFQKGANFVVKEAS